MKVWKNIQGILKVLLIAYLVIFAAEVLLPSLEHKKVSEEFAAAAGQLKEPAAAAGERVLNIEENEDALLWRLRLIENAKEEIVLSSFDFDSDQSGTDIQAALQAAARRGVKVRILVDGINGTLSWYTGAPLRALSAQPNVELKLYNPIDLLRPDRLCYRLHDKYLMVDDTALILGGRNTNDLFLGQTTEKSNHDRDILVWNPDGHGGVQQELKAYFQKVWELPVSRVRQPRLKNSTEKQAQLLEKRYETLKGKYPEAFQPMELEKETFPVNSISLWTNPIQPKSKEPQLWHLLQSRMMEGSSVRIQTPYIVCDSRMYEALDELAAPGRRVEIITNAVENGANPFGCSDYLNSKKKILGTGVEIYEQHSDQSAHTKTFLVDDRWSMVGSFNLDMRSTYLNSELMLAIDSPQLNARLQKAFDEGARSSVHVLADGTETPGEECELRTMAIAKKLLYTVMRLLTLPVRHLL